MRNARHGQHRRTPSRRRPPKVDKFKFYDLIIYAARGSLAARRLATTLGSRRWRDDLPERYTRRRPYFRGNRSPMVVNWGSTIHPHWLDDPRFKLTPTWVNRAEAVGGAINKLEFFRLLAGVDGVPLLKWTADKGEAVKWFTKKDCGGAVARTKLTGSAGQGIVLSKNAEGLPDAPLYTRLYPKTHEFRVHMFNGQMIDLTQKKLKGGPSDNADRFVRSLDNGWVHAHGELDLAPEDHAALATACALALDKLTLVFGACDVLAILEPPDADTKRRLKSFVICEINTGPGLENTKTIEAYSKAILGYREEKSALHNKTVQN